MLMTVCAMTATIMQALDTTIANVALPYMQGSLSASLDQINWVLTSYIVAAAIMTAPIGWLADRFGRKKLFIICVAGFTVASLLCALAQNIEQMVLFRLLQGMFGAALVPLSQSVMLDAYPPEERGQAMAIWGMGVMLGPIMGPTLGGWLTDNYSWHWVFLINLPIGIVTVLGLMLFMDETKKQEHLRFDWFGFIALADRHRLAATDARPRRAGRLVRFQRDLDRGDRLGRRLLLFLRPFADHDEPFVRFEMFKDRNFVSGCLFMVVIGVVLFGTMALVTPFMQNLLGYPILTAGFLLGSRGVGTLIAMMAAPRLMQMVQPRYLILCWPAARRRHALLHDRLFARRRRRRRSSSPASSRASASAWCSCRSRRWRLPRCPAHLRTGGTAITDAGAQYRHLDRHFDGDRQSDQQDDRDARAADRARHAVQRRACRCPMWPGT